MRVRWLAVALAVAACSSSAPGHAPARKPRPAVPSSSTSTSTTSTTVVAPVAAQPATPTCPAIPARAEPSPDRPRYRLRVDVRPGENLVDGDLTVRFTPTTATDRLVFRLWPGRRLTTEGVTVDGHGVTAERTNDTTLVVPLGRTTTDTLRATMHWVLTLPGAEPDRIARIGDTVRLGSFFPILGWDGGGWTYEPPTSNFAEASTAPTADFEVEVTTPPGLTALVSGDGHAVAMRDVGIAVGRFRVVDGAAGPVHVRVAVENGLPDDPRSYLPTIVGALDDFSRRFGPYPWPTYTMVVTPALKGGIEYPGLVHQGPSTQGRSTPHEVGHQWFYGLVGDDQGRDPWLDEGLATWAEARFRGNLDQFRAVDIPPDAAGRTGAPMTYWEGRSSYYRGVYVQGAQALAALGPPDLVDCALRLYVARNAYRVARPSDLLDSLRAVFPDAAGVLARYGASAGP